MPGLLIFLFILCTVCLLFNGAWAAFFKEDVDRIQTNWGIIKFILALVTLVWAIIDLHPMFQGG